jgi:cell division protein FtsZ
VRKVFSSITEAADPEANIIFGSVINDSYTGEIKVTVVATGFDDDKRGINIARPLGEFRPVAKRSNTEPSSSLFGKKPATTPAKPNIQAQPTMEASKTGTPQMPGIEDTGNEYDIPAFIRQKMNK